MKTTVNSARGGPSEVLKSATKARYAPTVAAGISQSPAKPTKIVTFNLNESMEHKITNADERATEVDK